ncbi:uncharacterized protein LOC127867596 [Dreissena polymorpha]|uniref:TIR domain-containing protein n=1 Tax=Dreissena polymorpha TaxID=45954 RepID=A0A9D4RGJ3_DREPO|nr:uncharacterized protein LOC127867596 [Dreissena polymorpha]KAH3867706.1 hypothetical protein DPMN_030839 [Dreissena polymorpha]
MIPKTDTDIMLKLLITFRMFSLITFVSPEVSLNCTSYPCNSSSSSTMSFGPSPTATYLMPTESNFETQLSVAMTPDTVTDVTKAPHSHHSVTGLVIPSKSKSLKEAIVPSEQSSTIVITEITDTSAPNSRNPEREIASTSKSYSVTAISETSEPNYSTEISGYSKQNTTIIFETSSEHKSIEERILRSDQGSTNETNLTSKTYTTTDPNLEGQRIIEQFSKMLYNNTELQTIANQHRAVSDLTALKGSASVNSSSDVLVQHGPSLKLKPTLLSEGNLADQERKLEVKPKVDDTIVNSSILKDVFSSKSFNTSNKPNFTSNALMHTFHDKKVKSSLDDVLEQMKKLKKQFKKETPVQVSNVTWQLFLPPTKRPIEHPLSKAVITSEMQSNNGVTSFPEGLDPRYNACSAQTPMKERQCGPHVCVFGTCKQEVVNHGTWQGTKIVCECDIGARGLDCSERCCLDCGENGRCNLLKNTEVCDCRSRYVGERCETRLPDPVSVVEKENTWYMWVVGACVGTFVVLLIGTVVILYYMWRHRVILVMKIVHYFQAYEDDDEKKWDAFVSYRSHPTEDDFVLNTLYPKLEKELGFTLCLHFRDFVPGETISNNIINAVDGSRRTILILTPRYIESEFTRFEYEKAQQEMLKRKHRIIPIVLEDISGLSSTMDKSLKAIISSVTYLEWPIESESKKIDKFWKRLQLSLPKKKVADIGMSLDSNGTTLTDFSSSVSNSVVSSSKQYLPPINESDFCNSASTFRCDQKDDTGKNNEDNESIYEEISEIDRSICGPIKFVKMCEDKDKDTVQNVYSLIEDSHSEYVDMSDDLYLEFKPEDQIGDFVSEMTGYFECDV